MLQLVIQDTIGLEALESACISYSYPRDCGTCVTKIYFFFFLKPIFDEAQEVKKAEKTYSSDTAQKFYTENSISIFAVRFDVRILEYLFVHPRI